jgi:hypothetical protein
MAGLDDRLFHFCFEHAVMFPPRRGTDMARPRRRKNVHEQANSISKSRWKREGWRAATRQYAMYGEEPRSAADKVNA